MGIRKTVFASKAERRNFEHIARGWGDRYRLYPNLPFLNVFDASHLLDPQTYEPVQLDDRDLARLKKTSIDYTLCDEHDVPLLCIEFDGLQDGFNVGSKYHTDLPSSPWRELIMDLKLRVAHGSMFPFVVIGSPHFEHISANSRLAIVDGIIGDVLSSKAVSDRVAQGIKPEDLGMSDDQLSTLTDAQRHKVIQEWVWRFEAEADFAHNPIYGACFALQDELHLYDLSLEWVSYPDPNKARDPAERRKMIDAETLVGSKVTVEHPTLGKSTATVMLPNFKTVGVSPILLSQELAHLVALDRLKQRLSQT